MLELKTPQDFLVMLKRRKWMLIVPLAFGLVLSAAAALLWPPVYRSSATILIERPEVKGELVASTAISYDADQRVQVISQRIMTTRNLISIIEKYDLYSERRKRDPIGIVAQKMRENIILSLVSSDDGDGRSSRRGQMNIAFTLAFEHKSPVDALNVLNELVKLFMDENERTRRKAAADMTAFLRSEAEKHSQLVEQYETRLALFKQQHAGNLPEQVPVLKQLKDRNERELLEVRGRLQSLEEQRIYLEAELAQLNPYLEVPAPSTEPTGPMEVLRALRIEYVTLSSKYGPSHPDVRKIEREIEALEKDFGPQGRRAALEAERDALVTQLGELRARYSDKHPDVVRIQRQLDNVEAKLATMPAAGEAGGGLQSSRNPAYIRLQAQLKAIDTDIRSLTEQQKQLTDRLQMFEQELLEAPEIEREYRLLTRDYERTLTNYNTVKEKLTTAELSESLETESGAEQFTLVEPPAVPTEPIKPNRLAIFVIGLVLSLTVGGSLATVTEVMDSTVYGPLQLSSVAGAPPLVVVPRIRTAADIRREWTIRVLSVIVFVAVFVGAALTIHYFVRPFDVMLAAPEPNSKSVISGAGGN